MYKNFRLRNLLFIALLSISSGVPVPASGNFSDHIPQCIKDHPIATGLATTVGASLAYYCGPEKEERWDWNKIKLEDVNFGTGFLWGPSGSAWQEEGNVSVDHEGKIITVENNWTQAEQEEIIKNDKKQLRIPVENRVGDAAQGWTRWKEDIELCANIGANCKRISIAREKIEPTKGHYCAAAMQHYIDVIKECNKNGIEVVVTLYHHTEPTYSKGFEDPETIQDFTRYAVHVFTECKKAGLLEKNNKWLTFNEPAGYALAAYVYGKYPPFKKFHLTECGTFLKNMLDAHVAIYDEYKKIAPAVKVSLAHMMQPIQPYHPWSPLEQLATKTFNRLLNDVTLEYLSTGNFTWPSITMPSLKDLTPINLYKRLASGLIFKTEHNSQAKGKLDFVGVNYYTHTLLKTVFSKKVLDEATRPDELTADTDEGTIGKSIYAEGFYDSLKKVARYFPGKDIFITENGFASKDPALRTEYIKKHLYVIDKVRKEGIPVIGYLWWTFIGGYGWGSGNSNKHTIFNVDFKTQERTLNPSAHYLVDTFKRHTKN